VDREIPCGTARPPRPRSAARRSRGLRTPPWFLFFSAFSLVGTGREHTPSLAHHEQTEPEPEQPTRNRENPLPPDQSCDHRAGSSHRDALTNRRGDRPTKLTARCAVRMQDRERIGRASSPRTKETAIPRRLPSRRGDSNPRPLHYERLSAGLIWLCRAKIGGLRGAGNACFCRVRDLFREHIF
jgi:hypothetical protein